MRKLSAPNGTISVQVQRGSSVYNPPATTGPQMPDPLASLVLPPSMAGLSPRTGNPCTGGPGIYGSFTWANNDNCALPAGLYVLTGTWGLRNNTVIRGTGVTLYATCGTTSAVRPCNSPGEAGGQFDGKNGAPQFTAPTTGLLAGLAIVYDRKNTSPVTLQGNGASNIGGTVYAIASTLDANGNACFTVNNGSIVVNDVYLNGNPSCFNVTNGAAQTYQLDPDGLHLDE